MSTWIKIKGTQGGNFQLGFTGPVLQNSSGNLDVKNSANSAYVDITAANITTSGGVFTGNAAGLTSIPGANVTGTVTNASTVTANAQPNITSVGILTSLSVTGNTEVGNLLTNNIKYANGESYQFTTNAAGSNTQVQFNNNNIFGASANFTFSTDTNVLTVTSISANGALLSSLTGANVTGTVANASYATTAGSADSATTAGTVTANAQPNITSVGTLSSLSVSGNAGIGNLEIGSGLGGSLVGANLLSANFITGTITTAAQPNITSVGTLSTLSVSGSANVGSVNTSGNVTAAYFIGNGSQLTGLSAGTANTAETVTNNAQPNITSLGTLTSLSVAGNAVISGNLTVSGNIAYVNVETLQVQDPIIELGGGPNGAPLTTNDGKDRGSLLHYYTGSPVDAFMGWDNSNSEFAFGSNVTVTSDVVTFNTLGNVRASTFIGALSGTATFAGTANSVAGANVSGEVAFAATANSVAGANVSGEVATANTAGTVTTNAQPNITSVGTLTGLTVNGVTSLGSVSNVNITGGSSGYILSTDGTGNLSWNAPTTPAGMMTVDSTSFAFGSGATISAFTLPANAIVNNVSIIVDTGFNGTAPTITVGLNGGSATVYAEAGDSDLKVAGRYDIPSEVAPVGSTGSIELYYTASGSSAGAGRVVITYSTPV